jgi:hypothetical protein
LVALVGGIAALSAGAVMIATATIAGLAAFAPVYFFWDWLESYLDDRVVALVHPPDGHGRQLLEHHIGAIELLPASGGEPWGVTVPHRSGSIRVRGASAKQLLSQLLARLNRRGASEHEVAEAVALIARAGDSEQFISWAARAREERRQSGEVFRDSEIGAFGLSDTERVALEMAVNEDAERAALDGDLQALREAWRDAEEIAGIADDLLVTERIGRMLTRLRGTLRRNEAFEERDA